MVMSEVTTTPKCHGCVLVVAINYLVVVCADFLIWILAWTLDREAYRRRKWNLDSPSKMRTLLFELRML
jgi:hypothetical protein